MLVFSAQNLAFIAVPKTGTTAIELALKPRADIIFTKKRKHLTAQRFHNRIAPFLATEFDLRPDRFAVMREPEEQIRSWFRYRAREAKQGSALSTEGIGFDEFVRAVISDDPPPYAGIGSQFAMLTSGKGKVLVHHLFAHESPLKLHAFLDARFGEPITLKSRNVSPPVAAELEPDTRRKLVAARQAEFDLYTRLADAGGHLQTAL
ncbi:MAG: hypothetical protein VXW58_06975 [Pseudomonadota bacterium]|nr:hypothetical protein [Pseudomonadota bacterium]